MTYPPQGNQYPPQPGEPYGQQPQYGQAPQYGEQPTYGQAPQYGQQYGQPPYGQGASTNLASWIQRVGGYIIDSLIVAPFSVLASVLGQDTGANGLPTYNAMYFVFTLLGLLVTGYNRWYLGGKTGQSWGRKALGLRLVGEATGQPIGVGKAFLRDICHILDSLACLIGWLFPLWDAKRQTFADKILKTVVVK
jgi:uncharacterized RDD family membrane protein YckC